MNNRRRSFFFSLHIFCVEAISHATVISPMAFMYVLNVLFIIIISKHRWSVANCQYNSRVCSEWELFGRRRIVCVHVQERHRERGRRDREGRQYRSRARHFSINHENRPVRNLYAFICGSNGKKLPPRIWWLSILLSLPFWLLLLTRISKFVSFPPLLCGVWVSLFLSLSLSFCL